MARDHYVPQFLLRNFHIPGKAGLIYSYRRNRRPREMSIRKVAQEEDYYDIKSDDPSMNKDMIDKLLFMSEDTAAPILNRLRTGSLQGLSNDEVANLSWFVGLLACRTPAVRETIASINTGISRREFKKMLRTETEFEEILKRHPDMSGETLGEVRRAFLAGDIVMDLKRGGQTEDFLMGQQLQFAKNVVDFLQNRDWILGETTCSLSFLISDNPVVQMPVHGHPRDMGWGVANGHILFPITPKRALLFVISPESRDGLRLRQNIMPMRRAKMPELQFYIITQCRSAVYSHVLSKEFQRVLDSTEEGRAQTAYIPGA